MTTYTLDGVEGPSVNYTGTDENMNVTVKGVKFQYSYKEAQTNVIKTSPEFLVLDKKNFNLIFENVAIGSKITLYVSAKGSTNAKFSALTGCTADDADAANSVDKKDNIADYVALAFTANASTVTIGETGAGYRISKVVVEEGDDDQGGDVTPTEAKIWDFTKMSEEAKTALANNEKWIFENNRYSYNEQIAKDTYVDLASIGFIDGEGISVGRRTGGNLGAKNIRIDVDQRIQLNASDGVFKVTNLVKGDKVAIRYKNAGSDEERTFTVTNADVTTLVAPKSNETDAQKDVTLIVAANGDLELQQSKAINVIAIAVNTDLPGGGETGISSVQTSTVANGAVYNLAGQQVDASYKGIVIKDGKKYVQK